MLGHNKIVGHEELTSRTWYDTQAEKTWQLNQPTDSRRGSYLASARCWGITRQWVVKNRQVGHDVALKRRWHGNSAGHDDQPNYRQKTLEHNKVVGDKEPTSRTWRGTQTKMTWQLSRTWWSTQLQADEDVPSQCKMLGNHKVLGHEEIASGTWHGTQTEMTWQLSRRLWTKFEIHRLGKYFWHK
jgi:hypothetical protein